MKTKKDEILRLLGHGLTPAEIAKIVGCSYNYVFVVDWRDRHPGYSTEWTRKWRATPAGRKATDDYFKRQKEAAHA